MHVLQSFKDYFPPTVGGVEGHISQIVNNMEGIDFTVLTASRSRLTVRECLDGVDIIRLAEWARPAATPIMPTWRRELREAAPDVVHAHMPNPFGEICVLTLDTPPIVASYHADIVGRPRLAKAFEPLRQRFFARAERIVVGSTRLADSAPALAPHRRKVEVVPYGVDVPSWRARPDEADGIHERFPGPLVVFVGRHRHYKGLDVLVGAMAEVNATCLIAGDGPRRKPSEDLVRSMGLQDKVVFPGEISGLERSAYYHAADVFVLPSTNRAESYGISMLEAMATGTPVISTEVGTATSWINQDGLTGLVVEPGNPAQLAQAINKLLADEALRKELGAAAQRRAESDFSEQKMLALLREIYADLAGPR